VTLSPAPASGLPPLLSGRRRGLFALLVLTGLGQAVAAGATVVVLTRGLAATTTGARVVAVGVLVGVAVMVGWVRSRERLLAEQLGQDYVHEIRLRLVRRALDGHRRSSLGVTLTRASNDLTAVRNWVSLGVSPVVSGVPLLLGCAVVLAFIHPAIALAVLAPLAVLGGLLWIGSRAAYKQSRRVRRERGRLAAHLADTLTATTAIRSAGGGYRELRRVDRRSAKVVQAAIDRARVIGRIRGSASAATGIATASVIGGSMLAGLGGAQLAAALTVVGLMAAPVQEMARVVEYRQSFRAARQMLAPALAPVAVPGTGAPRANPVPAETDRAAAPHPEVDAGSAFYGQLGLVVRGMRLADSPEVEVPALYARPGDRVVLEAGDRAWGTAVLDALVGIRPPVTGDIRISGTDLAEATFRERRRLFGYAAQGLRLERTTVSRAVRYRSPESDAHAVGDVLARVGLAGRVAALPGGQSARLRQGGEPLTPPDRARLLLARAMFGDPPLLVLDHLDADLGERGREVLRGLLDGYPGVVVLASDAPEAVMTPTRRWHVG
jgi:ABC-type multidrug transport system fused ATPase/permease subunit